jgi:hypothetical protein
LKSNVCSHLPADLRPRVERASEPVPSENYKRAADAGFSENDIAAALGQANPASARPYTIEGSRTQGAKRVIRALDRKK